MDIESLKEKARKDKNNWLNDLDTILSEDDFMNKIVEMVTREVCEEIKKLDAPHKEYSVVEAQAKIIQQMVDNINNILSQLKEQ